MPHNEDRLSQLKSQLAQTRARRSPRSVVGTLIANLQNEPTPVPPGPPGPPPLTPEQELDQYLSNRGIQLPTVAGSLPGPVRGGYTSPDGTGYATITMPTLGGPLEPAPVIAPPPLPILAPPPQGTKKRPGKQ